MRSLIIRTSLTALLVVAASPFALGQSEGIAWRTDLEAAKAEARQSGKLVLAHFWTESCGPCRKLEANVFSQPSVAMALNDSYVPVKINANEAPEIAQAYGVTRVPTDAVVTAEGQLVKAFVSPATPMDYVGLTTRLAAAYKTQIGGAYAAVAANAPIANPSVTAPPTAPVPESTNAFNEAYAQMMGAAAPAAQPAQQPPAQQQPAASRTENPYMTQAAAAPRAPITPIGVDQQPAPQAAVAPQQQVASAGPKLPPGSPPLGFEGYCPVALKTENRWAEGDVRFGAIHRGRTYLFTSAEAQRQFLASPDAYSPVLAGSDPVVAVDERRAVAGSRDFGVEYPASGGRFYLFSSEQSLEKFWRDPAAYAKGAERVAALPASDTFIR